MLKIYHKFTHAGIEGLQCMARANAQIMITDAPSNKKD